MRRAVSWHAAGRVLVAGTMALATVSCAPSNPKPLFPVAGRVLLNGKPVAHAFVVFHPVNALESDSVRPHAQADARGSFVLSTYQDRDGAPSGEYRITVQQYKPPTESDKGPPVNLLPTRYAKPDTSNLSARVEEGRNDLPPLHLKR